MFIFFSALVIISVFLCFFLALFFLVTPRGSARENKILASLLTIFALQIIYSFMTSNYAFRYFMEWHKGLYLIRQASFLTGPLVYFYLVASLKKQEIIDRRNLWHFMPLAVSVIGLMIYYSFHEKFVIWEFEYGMLNTILILASNFIYILLSYNYLKKSKINIKCLFANRTDSTHLTWLLVLLIGYIVLWIVNLNSFTIYMIAMKPGWCSYTASIFALVLFLFISLLVFLLLIKPDIYYVLEKYQTSKLKKPEMEDHVQRLNTHLTVHKSYLDPDITLESLANEIGIKPRILSQIINTTFGKTFKHFILEYRINESMKILADEKRKDLTILEVLYQVGFNSKSTFNHQFKLYTNLTPQEFRKRIFTGSDRQDFI